MSETAPEMKKALVRDHFELLEAMVSGLHFLCEVMRKPTGPHIENQRIIADSGVFDVCDCIFSTISFERRRDTAEKISKHEFKGAQEEISADHERLQKRNQMRNKLRLAAISILDVFLEGVEVVEPLQEEQVGDLLDVVAVTNPRVLENVGVVPDFGDDGGGVGHGQEDSPR